MAATVTNTARLKTNNGQIVISTVLLDSSYPTGGEAITANQLGLGTIQGVLVAGNAAGYGAEWVAADNKLKMYHVDNNAAGDSAMIEVPDETDLEAVTVTVLAIGR